MIGGMVDCRSDFDGCALMARLPPKPEGHQNGEGLPKDVEGRVAEGSTKSREILLRDLVCEPFIRDIVDEKDAP